MRSMHNSKVEYQTWRTRNLADGDSVYVWVDDVHFSVHFRVWLKIVSARP
jgi:hypothetical protein